MSKSKRRSNGKVNYHAGENIHDDVTLNRINWFPGHMNKAIREIKERIKKVDIILEIRDARSPLVTGNKAIHEVLGEKNRLIVINKTDLADPETIKLWVPWFEAQGVPFIFINCFDKASLAKIAENASRVVQSHRLVSNKDIGQKAKLKMMVIGLPNTGKSTIINKLAERNATKVADKPGQTRQQLWITVNEEINLLDTPGIMPPKIESYQQGLWLAALNCIPEKIVDSEDTACFIIKHLLEVKSEGFKQRYKLEHLDFDLIGVLDAIAVLRGCIKKKNEYDYERVYKLVVADFRSGELGPVSLGIPPKLRSK